MLVAKIALGIASTVAFATIYTFREGLIKVDVDEFRAGGSHVHVWVPAAAFRRSCISLRRQHMQNATEQLEPFMPTIRQLAKELKNIQTPSLSTSSMARTMCKLAPAAESCRSTW